MTLARDGSATSLARAVLVRLAPVVAVQAAVVSLVRASGVPAQFPPFLFGEITPIGFVHCATINAVALGVGLVERTFGTTRAGRLFAVWFPVVAFVFCDHLVLDPIVVRFVYLALAIPPIAVFALMPLPGGATSFDEDAS